MEIDLSKSIVKNAYYISSKDEKVYFFAFEETFFIRRRGRTLKKIYFKPNIGVNNINCSNFKVKELILPESVKQVDCSINKLKELILPEGIKKVDCCGNNITELLLPDGVEEVSCKNNPINSINIPKSLKKLHIDEGVVKDYSSVPENLKIHLNILK